MKNKADMELLRAINLHMSLKEIKPIAYFQELFKCKLVQSYTKNDIFVGHFISEAGVEFTVHTYENEIITKLCW